MRIVFLVSSLNAGGAERVATALSNAWATRGDRVTLIPTYSAGGQPFYALAPAVETVFLADVAGRGRKTPWTYATRLLALRRLITTRRPDVVLSFLPNVNVAALLATAGLRVPVIICERSNPASRPQWSALELLCRLTYRHADLLTVQTREVAAAAEARYPGVTGIVVVPNPLPLDPPRAACPAQPRKVLLSLGRLSEEKRVGCMIDAFAGLAPRFLDWDFHIYGDGPLRADLERQALSLGLGHRVLFMGRTDAALDVMAHADAFVLASRYEGFPNALLEAMSVGLPCIATDCANGPREITRGGQDALLVPPHDMAGLAVALGQIMADPGLRDRLGRQARDSVAKRYRSDAVLAIWDSIFARVGVRASAWMTVDA